MSTSLSKFAVKTAIAAAFLGFGACAFAAPDALASIGATDSEPATPIGALAIAALGAHAIAAGLFAALAPFKSLTFPGYALALLPIFAADGWLGVNAPALSGLAAAHAAGLALVVALCAIGFHAAQRPERLPDQRA